MESVPTDALSNNPAGGFVYRREQNSKGKEFGGIVPHTTLKSVENNEPLAEEVLVDHPEKVSVPGFIIRLDTEAKRYLVALAGSADRPVGRIAGCPSRWPSRSPHPSPVPKVNLADLEVGGTAGLAAGATTLSRALP